MKRRGRTLLNSVFILSLLSGIAVNAVVARQFGLFGSYGYGGQPPSAPQSIVVFPAGCGATQVTWTSPQSEGSSPITGYVVRARDGSTIVASDTVDASTFSDTISGLTNGTSYAITVAAFNAAGEGPETTPAIVVPLCVPGKPLAVVAAPQCDGFDLTWSAPLDDGGTPIRSYIVWVRNDGQLVATDRVDGAQLKDTIANLTTGKGYTVTVSAANSVGVGPPSDPINVTPACHAAAPSVPQDVIGSPLCGGAELDWNAPARDGTSAITGYVVFVRTDGALVATDLVDGNTFTDAISGLDNGTSFEVSVAAVNKYGVGVESDPVEVVPDCSPSPPTQPLGVIASPACNGIGVDWNGPASDGGSPVTGYVVFVRTSGTLVATDLVDGSTFTDAISGLTNGTAYDVTVAGVNANGVSLESASVEIVPDCPQSAPTDPVGVNAVPLCSSVEADWNPPTSDGGSPITGYTVFVRNQDGTLVTTDVIADPTTFSDVISGLTDGTVYEVSVAATNAIGTGPESDVVQIAPECPATVPDPPVSVTAAAQCEATSVGWSAPSNDGNSQITGYTVYVRNGGQTFSDTVGGSTFTDTIGGLTDGTQYAVTVKATNAIGDSVESSPPVTVTPVCTPSVPLATTAEAQCESTFVGWNAPASDGGTPVTGYTVYVRGGSQTFSDTVGGSTFSDTIGGLTDGTQYAVTVKATNAVGDSAETSAVLVTPVCTPSAPVLVTASAQCESANIGWNAPASDGGTPVTTYTVLVRSGSQVVATPSADGSARSLAVTGLTDGTTYSVTVVATNAVGSSLESNAALVTPICAPSAPLAVTAAAQCTGALVAWHAPAFIGGAPVTGYTLSVRTVSSLTAFTVGGSTLSDTISGLAGGTTYTVTVKATNAAGTSPESSPPVAFTTTCVPTSLAYTGDTQPGGGLLRISAVLSSSLAFCRTGQPIVFTLDRNPVTQAPGQFVVATLNTTASGQAGPVSIPASNWQAGHYILTSSYNGSPASAVFHCSPSSAMAQVTVSHSSGGHGPPPPFVGRLAAGAGVITVNGGTVFGFDLQQALGATAPTGSFTLLIGRNWRIAGRLTTYTSVHGVASASGVGDLYVVNRLHMWQPAALGVNVVLTFSGGGRGTGTFGFRIDYAPVPPQPAFSNTLPIPLTGGVIQVFH